MQNYTLNDALTKYSEVLTQATDEPVILTQESQPTHVILSVDNFEKLLQRLEELEKSGNEIQELVLSKRDCELFISAMQNPPEPSEGLRSLFHET
jgi:prevent-host-death family protein